MRHSLDMITLYAETVPPRRATTGSWENRVTVVESARGLTMPFKKIPAENARKRLVCPKCGGDKLIVEYGPLKNAHKGKHEMGFYGRCASADCNEKEHHISYGYSN